MPALCWEVGQASLAKDTRVTFWWEKTEKGRTEARAREGWLKDRSDF